MEIKGIVEELGLVNDISNMSIDELKEKYSSNFDDYENFLNRYRTFFESHQLYQLRVAEEYNKISELLSYGNSKYKSESTLENSDEILRKIEYTKNRFRIDEKGSIEDVIQAQYILLDAVGALYQKKMPTYKEVVSDIYSAASKYDIKESDSFDDFTHYVNNALKTSSNGKEFYNKIDEYVNEHPILEECNNMSYLYFVNYMLTHNKNKVDNSFIHDTESILLASKIMRHIGNVEKDFDQQSYEKVEKHTRKNIRKYYKNQEKTEKNIKKLSKSFLKR